MKKFFANSVLNFLFFFIITVSVFVYMEISLSIRLSTWAHAIVVALVVMLSDYIKKRCRESLEKNKN